MRLLMAAIAALMLVCAPDGARAGDVGVVFMHGKWGGPAAKSPVGKLKAALEEAGFEVVTPVMPWSRNRYLEKGYDESMGEIDEAVAELKSRGVTKIVVGGHSMGANAAIGYGARRDGLAGILAVAPGHVPDRIADKFAADVSRAKSMIADGKGAQTATFTDSNQGNYKDIQASAEDYLSWFDPKGPAVMPESVKRLKAPLFWIIGGDDPLAKAGEDYAFAKAPANPKNAYVGIDANHMNTPIKGAGDIIKWLKTL